MTTIHTDRAKNAAILERYNQLPPADQLALTENINVLRRDIENAGIATAREVLWALGRLMVESGTTRKRGM